MKEEIRPLLLVADKDVKLVTHEQPMQDRIAWVEKLGNRQVYTIHVVNPAARDMYMKSWLKDRITFQELIAGLIIHEVGHVKYGTFEGDQFHGNALLAYLNNVIEDARIEYQMTLDHPTYVRYIRWALTAMKPVYEASKIPAIPNKKMAKACALADMVFRLVRFGVIEEKADPSFINFCLPLLISSTRGARRNSVVTIRAIYDYIMQDMMEPEENEEEGFGSDTIDSMLGRGAVVKVVPMTKEDLESLAENEQIANSGNHSIAEQAMELFMEEESGGGDGPTLQLTRPEGQGEDDSEDDASDSPKDGDADGAKEWVRTMPGSGEHEIVIYEKDQSFYRKVVSQRMAVIAEMRQQFKKFFDAVSWKHDYDGDLNVVRQQEAYINSMTGDTGLDYLRMKRKDPGMDVVILRDVSGSTDPLKGPFAESIVAILASLEGLPKVHTALVDFGGSAAVVKTFDTDLRVARIFPRSDGGGTDAIAGLQRAEKFYWTADNRLCFIITDGEVNDPYNTARMVRRMNEEMGIDFMPVYIFPTDAAKSTYMRMHRNNRSVYHMDGMEYCTLDELPFVLGKKIVRRFK